jgi:RHS repeat-associated protein
MGCLKFTYSKNLSPLKLAYSKASEEKNNVQEFFSIDPLAAKYPDVSPYAFCLNNPIYYVDPDGRDPREGNQVVKVNFDKAFVMKINDDDEKFTTYDNVLRSRAADHFAHNTTIGGRMRFFGGINAAFFRLAQNVAKVEEIMREKVSPADVGNQFLRASKSSTGYDYIEFNSASTQMTYREVRNLGEGFENVVTFKQVQETGDDGDGTVQRVVQQSWTTLYTQHNEKTGKDEKMFKTSTLNYSYDESGNANITQEIKFEKAEPEKYTPTK